MEMINVRIVTIFSKPLVNYFFYDFIEIAINPYSKSDKFRYNTLIRTFGGIL